MTWRPRVSAVILIATALSVVFARPGFATPDLARTSGQACTACHSVWPFLNQPAAGDGGNLFPRAGPAVVLRNTGPGADFRPSIRIRGVSADRRRRGATAIQIIARPVEKLFFDLTPAETEAGRLGAGAQQFGGHVAVGVAPRLTVGAFGGAAVCEPGSGPCDAGTSKSQFGFDARLNFGNARFAAAYMGAAGDPADSGAGEADTAWRLEGAYVLSRGGRPYAVPLLRFEQYEASAGPGSRDELTVNIAFFPLESIRLRAEWWSQVTVPDDAPKNERFTIQFDIDF